MAAQVEEERRLAAEAGRRTTIPIAPQIMLSRTLQQAAGALDGAPKENNPFKAIEVLVVPENVTKLAKTDLKPNEPPLVEERDIALAKGETLESTIKGTGLASDEQIRGIVAALGGRTKTSALAEGQQMRVQIAPGAQPANARQVTRVVLYGENGIEGIAAINDRGTFVSVAPPTEDISGQKAQPQADAGDEEDEDSGSGPRLYQSLYETAGGTTSRAPPSRTSCGCSATTSTSSAGCRAATGSTSSIRMTRKAPAPTGRTCSMPRSPSAARPARCSASNRPMTARSIISTTRGAR